MNHIVVLIRGGVNFRRCSGSPASGIRVCSREQKLEGGDETIARWGAGKSTTLSRRFFFGAVEKVARIN